MRQFTGILLTIVSFWCVMILVVPSCTEKQNEVSQDEPIAFGSATDSDCCFYYVDTVGCLIEVTAYDMAANEVLSQCRYEKILSVDVNSVSLGQNGCCSEGVTQISKTTLCHPATRIYLKDIKVLEQQSLDPLVWFQGIQDTCFNLSSSGGSVTIPQPLQVINGVGDSLEVLSFLQLRDVQRDNQVQTVTGGSTLNVLGDTYGYLSVTFSTSGTITVDGVASTYSQASGISGITFPYLPDGSYYTNNVDITPDVGSTAIVQIIQ